MAENATVAPKIESKLRDLTNNTRKSLRLVMQNLAEMRSLTGVAEVVNLGKLLGEVGSEDTAAFPSDHRLRAAVKRGRQVKEKLTQVEGGSVSAQLAADTLGMSKQAILTRYKKGKLLGWKEERQEAVRFPVWQFEGGKVLDGLEIVLSKLNTDPSMDDSGRLLFFLSNSRFLKGKRPLDCLREGELHKVMQAVDGYVQ